MVTLKEVAHASGVSVATVSRILNNRGSHLPLEAREKVFAAVRELNYRPGSLSRSRSGRRTHTIGVLYPHYGGRRLQEQPYYAQLVDGILYFLSLHHWHTLIFAEFDWETAAQNLHDFYNGSCDGLIGLGPDESGNLVSDLLKRNFPFVLINSGKEHPAISCVDVDNVIAAQDITHYLMRQGHRRIAFLPGNRNHDSTRQRMDGFLMALSEAGLHCPPDWMPTGGYHQHSGYERTLRLLDSAPGERPTALFCANDDIARGAYRAIRERGLRIGVDVSVIGFDDQEFAKELDPPLTTMRQPLSELGERAAELLVTRIEMESPHNLPAQKTIVLVELIERASVGPPPPVV